MLNKDKLINWTLVTLAVAIALTIVFYSVKGFESPTSHTMNRVAYGEDLYNQHCAACHGINLEGQPDWKTRNAQGRLPAPPHDETGHTWHHSDQLLFEMTKFGMVPPNIPAGYESDMPAYKDILSDEQIRAVLGYIKSRWPEDIVKIQRERN